MTNTDAINHWPVEPQTDADVDMDMDVHVDVDVYMDVAACAECGVSNILVASHPKDLDEGPKCNMLSNKNVTSDDRNEDEDQTEEMCCTNLLETLTNEQYPYRG